MPQTFTSQRRELPGDSYWPRLLDPSTTDQWWSQELGDVDCFDLNGLPAGVQTARTYGWGVWVYVRDEGCCSPYRYHAVTFAASIVTGSLSMQ